MTSVYTGVDSAGEPGHPWSVVTIVFTHSVRFMLEPALPVPQECASVDAPKSVHVPVGADVLSSFH